MPEYYLYELLDMAAQMGNLKDVPNIIKSGLSENIVLREYQETAFKYFATYYETENLHKNKQIHTLFHMATGSGKTVIMAGLILYLYEKGYRNFLFFVNQTNIIEKTKDNFSNSLSNKYLFAKDLRHLGEKISIKIVDNFSKANDNEIQLLFTSTQKLHLDLNFARENTITYQDFEDNKIVFISDESHHINTNTKRLTTDEENEIKSWEYSVMNAFSQNKDNIMLEFTATMDFRNPNVKAKYVDKVIFDYTLKEFRASGYTKDFQNFATESELWDRTLMALILSEYRRFLFNDNKLNIKPVVMLKSQKINDSKEFYEEFYRNLNKLKAKELKSFIKTKIQILKEAMNYFIEKDATLELLKNSIVNSFSKEKTIIMNEKTDNNTEKQLLVNSLEDKSNPIRLIFTVDMLNEGWDVLNLFDIVRLYDTRQGSGVAGKVGNYTIKEAQLIGRGARYCPFQLNDEQDKFKRKYDNDLTNKNRILETMYFHSRNDSKYIAELRQALIQSGMQDPEPVEIKYILKDKFKESNFYKKALVFSNKRVQKSRKKVKSIEGRIKNNTYQYYVKDNSGNINNIMENDTIQTPNYKIKLLYFSDIDYNILQGTSQRFNELRFNAIKTKYPNVQSMREFLTNEDYLGKSSIEMHYLDTYCGRDIQKALIKAFSAIAEHMLDVKEEFEGTVEFVPVKLNQVLKDKSIYMSHIDANGGSGASQNHNTNENYQLDLFEEDWYVFNDNYGTSEEKLFLKFFKTHIEPKLKAKGLEFYVIRNERIPELAIYSFEHGERFEPDFLVFVKRKEGDNYKVSQVYAEPKGNNLLQQDEWKEEFLMQIGEKSESNAVANYEYEMLGLPFYNEEYKKDDFIKSINKWIDSL